MLDTLKANRNLLRAGFSEEQAEVIVEIEQQKQDELATKDFIDKKIAEVRTEIAEVRTEIAEVKGEVKVLSRLTYAILGILIVGFIKIIFFS